MTSTEITGRVTFNRHYVTKAGRPYLRVGIATEEGTEVYASVWENARYYELAPKMMRGTKVRVRGSLEGQNLKVEAGSWKLG